MMRSGSKSGWSRGCALAAALVVSWGSSSEGEGVNIRELLGDRGISEVLLKAERAHPYLFFAAEDVPGLREMARREPYRTCAEGIVRAARLTLENPIPAEPPAGAAESRLPDGSYDGSFLKATYDFLSYAYAMQYYGPLYAFAYLLTEEEVFAERAKAWALAFAGWENWGPAADPWDMEAAMILSGAVIVYDWIPEQFSDAERERLLSGLRGKGRKLCEKDAYWLTQDPAARRGGLANNHRWRSIPLEGLAGLGLLYEVEEARDWLDMGLVLTREYLLPAAYGRDGEADGGTGMAGGLPERRRAFHGGTGPKQRAGSVRYGAAAPAFALSDFRDGNVPVTRALQRAGGSAGACPEAARHGASMAGSEARFGPRYGGISGVLVQPGQGAL